MSGRFVTAEIGAAGVISGTMIKVPTGATDMQVMFYPGAAPISGLSNPSSQPVIGFFPSADVTPGQVWAALCAGELDAAAGNAWVGQWLAIPSDAKGIGVRVSQKQGSQVWTRGRIVFWIPEG